MMLDYYCNV